MKKFYLLCVICLILSVCACSSVPDKDSETAISSSDNLLEIHPISEIKDGRKNVYLILKSCSNSYWDSIVQGATDSSVSADVNLYYGGVKTETDGDTQNTLIQQAIDNGADAIILAPINCIPVLNTVADAYSKKIPVILVDTIIHSNNFDVCYMTDNIQAGEYAAREMISQLKLAGKSPNDSLHIGIQAGATNSQTIIDRVAGFMSYWSSNAPENWKVTDEVKINNGDIDLATEYAHEFISKYSDLAGLYGCNNGSTVGSIRGITESGRTDLVMVGYDYSDEMAEMLNSGKYHVSTMLQKQYVMGYDSVQTVNHLDKIDFKFVDTGVTIVNDKNIHTPSIQRELERN